MIFITVLLPLAIAVMAVTTVLPDDFTTAAATVTVTESMCMTGFAGDATPLSVADALANAADASAAVSLIAGMMANGYRGDAAAPRGGTDTNTTTVTAVASATNCPAVPTFDLTPALFSQALRNGGFNKTTAIDPNVDGIEAPHQRWSKGRNSLCFTSSSWVGTGFYAIYLDGWGQEHDGCGKGALDNLRGQCGDVDGWGCKHWGSGVLLTFYLSGATTKRCAMDAMWLASPKDQREEGLCCVYLGPSGGSMNTC